MINIHFHLCILNMIHHIIRRIHLLNNSHHDIRYMWSYRCKKGNLLHMLDMKLNQSSNILHHKNYIRSLLLLNTSNIVHSIHYHLHIHISMSSHLQFTTLPYTLYHIFHLTSRNNNPLNISIYLLLHPNLDA